MIPLVLEPLRTVDAGHKKLFGMVYIVMLRPSVLGLMLPESRLPGGQDIWCGCDSHGAGLLPPFPESPTLGFASLVLWEHTVFLRDLLGDLEFALKLQLCPEKILYHWGLRIKDPWSFLKSHRLENFSFIGSIKTSKFPIYLSLILWQVFWSD